MVDTQADIMAVEDPRGDTMATEDTQGDTTAMEGTQGIITKVMVRSIIPGGTAGGDMGIILAVIGGILGTMLIRVGGGLIRMSIQIPPMTTPIIILIQVPMPILIPIICLRRR